jgi:hypothetical protein
VFLHVARGLPSTAIAIKAMPLAEFAEAAILMLPFLMLDPFVGELMVTLGGGAGGGGGAEEVVVTEMPDAWPEVLPAAS